jgi:hypothetical protein
VDSGLLTKRVPLYWELLLRRPSEAPTDLSVRYRLLSCRRETMYFPTYFSFPLNRGFSFVSQGLDYLDHALWIMGPGECALCEAPLAGSECNLHL